MPQLSRVVSCIISNMTNLAVIALLLLTCYLIVILSLKIPGIFFWRGIYLFKKAEEQREKEEEKIAREDTRTKDSIYLTYITLLAPGFLILKSCFGVKENYRHTAIKTGLFT